jgi:hypothetical protein
MVSAGHSCGSQQLWGVSLLNQHMSSARMLQRHLVYIWVIEWRCYAVAFLLLYTFSKQAQVLA